MTKVLGRISFAEMPVTSIVHKAGATTSMAPATATGLMTAARLQNWQLQTT